ncbi:hypothetical protein AX14_006523, partial [Amanita brunnescens Koide BX004]
KDARNGRKAQDELSKAQGDIAAILEERETFIQQRRELLARDDELTTELNRVHRDYGAAIDDNTKFAANVDALEQSLALIKDELTNTKNLLSAAEHHRDKAERDCGDAVLRLDKADADRKRDKAFYEARITALTSTPIPTSQPDSEAPLSAAAIDRSVLMTRVKNLTKELSVRDAELAKLRSEVSLSDDVNTLRAELAEAKAVAARLSGMYEQKSKDFRDSELERLALLGKQILADGNASKETPPARPRPASRRGHQCSRSIGCTDQNSHGKNEQEVQPESPPSSQPFWQNEPLFTKHVAAVTTATMSALPHLPFEAAIANAFTTVRNVGPPPPLKLDKKPGNRRSGAPSPPTPAPASGIPQGNFTFADMVKAATSKSNDGDSKKKPSWRAIETSKALVLRPSTKGTRVSELHLRVPKTTESTELFKLKGSALLDRVAKLISDHSEPAPRMALRENPLVFVKWSMRGNLVLKCAKPMDDLIKEGIKDAIAYFFPSPSAEVMILNKPPTTALKFLAVPRHNLDGSDTDEMDLLNDLTAHPAWANVELWSNPKFINLKAGMAGATVVISVIDDNQGSIAGNERADELTKAGLRLCPTNPPQVLRSHFLSQHRHRAEHDWQRRWKDTTYRGSQWLPIRRKKKVFKPSFTKDARNFFHNMAKGDASYLSRIAHVLTNHAPTGEYRTRFFPDEPTACPHCDEDTLQTRRHILAECPWYVHAFVSMTDWGKNRHNDKVLTGFLDKNPSAFTFSDCPLDVH